LRQRHFGMKLRIGCRNSIASRPRSIGERRQGGGSAQANDIETST
jgi:hypothetical protein